MKTMGYHMYSEGITCPVEGYHECTRECSLHRGDVMCTRGDIMINVGEVIRKTIKFAWKPQ